MAAILVALVAHRQLLVPVGFASRDHIDWYIRVIQLAREWGALHWPQTLPDAFFGAGHAFPQFYPPLSGWVAAGIYGLLPDAVAATHVTGLLAMVTGSVLHLLLIRWLTGNGFLAAAGAVAYSLFPYTLQQLQARGALAEVWAGAWYPLVLLGALKSADTDRLQPLYPVALALLILSHMVMAAWVLPVLVLVVALSRPTPARAIRQACAASVIAVGLASFHLLPAITGVAATRAADPEVVFATPRAVTEAAGALTGSPWSKALFVGLVLITVRLLVLAWRRRRAGKAQGYWRPAAIAVLALTAMMTAPESIWALVPESLRYIQFPVRLLSPIAFLVLIGAVDRLRAIRPPAPLQALVFAVAFAFAYTLGREPLIPRSLRKDDVVRLMKSEYAGGGFTVAAEYLPLGTDPEILVARIERIRREIGTGALREWDTSGPDPIARVEVVPPGRVILPMVHYGFLTVRLQEGPASIEDDGGLLAVRLPAGSHSLTVGRTTPPTLLAGMIISTGTLLGMAAWFRRRQSP